MQYCKQIMISSSIHLPQLSRTTSQPVIGHLGICLTSHQLSSEVYSHPSAVLIPVLYYGGSQMALVVKNWPASAGDVRDAC